MVSDLVCPWALGLFQHVVEVRLRHQLVATNLRAHELYDKGLFRNSAAAIFSTA